MPIYRKDIPFKAIGKLANAKIPIVKPKAVRMAQMKPSAMPAMPAPPKIPAGFPSPPKSAPTAPRSTNSFGHARKKQTKGIF